MKFAQLKFARQKEGYLGWPSRRSRRIRACDPEPPSLNYLVVHSLGPPKIPNPESKIQIRNPNFLFEFWSLDFGPCSNSSCEAPACPESMELDFGFQTVMWHFFLCEFWYSDFGFWDMLWTLHKVILGTPTRVGRLRDTKHYNVLQSSKC